MKVATYYNNKDIRIEQIPRPKIASSELLVKVMASGICGSDVMQWYRIKKAPLVLGHEITGIIEEIGKDVKKYKKGDRVFVSHHVPCNACHYCLSGHHTACDMLHNTNYFPGGFSEYIRVPQINVDRGVFILPDEVSFEQGTFIEPLACVVRAQRMVQLKPNQNVLILGSGISGLLHIQLAKAQGAGKIFATDINKYRLNKAKEFGANAVIDAKEDIPKRLKELNNNILADLVIVCAGALSVFNQALESAERGGTILLFAPHKPGSSLSIPTYDFWRNDLRLVPSYGAAPYDITEAIKLIQNKHLNLEKMITHNLPLEETGIGFGLVSDAKESIKVIIHPNGSKE